MELSEESVSKKSWESLANNVSANRLTHAVTLLSRFQLVNFSGFINGCETSKSKVIFGLTISVRHSCERFSCPTHFPWGQSSSCSYRNRGPLNQRCSLVSTFACSLRFASSEQFKSVGTCRHCLGLDFWWTSDTRLATKVLNFLDWSWIQKITSLLSVHSVQFEKGVYNSSDTFLANLRPNTAAMSSNLGGVFTPTGSPGFPMLCLSDRRRTS